MKRISAILLLWAVLLSVTACGGKTTEKNEKAENESSAISESSETSDISTENSSEAVSDTSSEIPDEPVYVYVTDNIKIEGIYVDDSYRDDDNSPLRMVYLFYTLTATDENLKADSVYTELKINEKNTYKSAHFPRVCKYMSNYYYSSYIEDVYIGTSLKVVATFKIPEAELSSGRSITLSDMQMPNEEKLRMNTDDIVHCNGMEEIAALADKEGYSRQMYLREEADAATTKSVQSKINGYYWSFYVNSTSYEMEFSNTNKFEVRTRFGSNSGTYKVCNGYLICTYSSNGSVVEVPYEIVNGEIKLDMTSAFDVKEG